MPYERLSHGQFKYRTKTAFASSPPKKNQIGIPPSIREGTIIDDELVLQFI